MEGLRGLSKKSPYYTFTVQRTYHKKKLSVSRREAVKAYGEIAEKYQAFRVYSWVIQQHCSN
jgi:hypothetical protein